ncbi:MAG: hypothetical protein QGG58_03075 [Chloroflexota bacterium]|nr:hypothetical protein [Chloroflexota bacterium]
MLPGSPTVFAISARYSRSKPAMYPRNQGVDSNSSAWVISCSATQRRIEIGSTRVLRATASIFGSTK